MAQIDSASNIEQPLTTADGVPLKVSLQRTLRRQKIVALSLVAPLFLFILFSFLFPIGDMLLRSIDNTIVPSELPQTTKLLQNWNEQSGELPNEAVYAALAADIKKGAKSKTINRTGKRLNYEYSGFSSLFRKSARRVQRLKADKVESYRKELIKIDKKWGNIKFWQVLKRESGIRTASYYLAAFDAETNEKGEAVFKPENERIYVNLFGRTLLLSFFITLMTVLLGYPIAFLLASLPTRISNLLMILVLLPFWTSLLVRTSSWIALLQKEGIINDFLVALNIIDSSNRLSLIHNSTGTVIAMTHILLPFMVLPLFSVMKTIPPDFMRAARSLGATPFTAFRRIYMPNTIPGIGAGGILVFILAIGYYITPALVGGTDGTFISNFIAYHISTSLNWGLAAALGALLLLLVLALYLLYDKIVGIDNMKLG
ncbi:MAG: ABC transporter permease [SAR324 cluster bacterium]|nr:ABC transporter permease [SAR324 cluster bacterium]